MSLVANLVKGSTLVVVASLRSRGGAKSRVRGRNFADFEMDQSLNLEQFLPSLVQACTLNSSPLSFEFDSVDGQTMTNGDLI